MNRLILFILLVSIFNVADVYSIEVEGLYSAKIKVVDQTRQSRNQAYLYAFKEILVRKSGSRAILSTDEAQKAYSKVTSYLQRFEYNRLDDIDKSITNLTPNNKLTSQAAYQFELLLDFEPRLIDELIQSAGMPIWGSNRPLTIIWLAFEDDFQRVIIKDHQQEGSFSNVLNQNAIRRGIPLLLPLVDLEDQLVINISDIWGRFTKPIVKASKRYAANSIVMGRISQLDGNWQAKLSYIVDGTEQALELTADDTENLIALLTDNIAELLCEKYCVVKAAERHQVLMQISNIKDFASYKKLEKYLSGLSSIRQVKVNKLSSNHIQLDISLLGELLAVKDALSLGHKLIEEVKPELDVFKESVRNAVEVANFNALSDHSALGVKDVTSDKAQGTSIQGTSVQETSIQETLNQGSHTGVRKSATLYYRWVE